MADLKTGKYWLTLTVGNWLTEASKDHPKLGVEKLALDKTAAQIVKISKPKFYHGRVLFEDGSPAIIDPVPWPGAEIEIAFPYAGSARVDSEGYFKVYFTSEQYEKAKAEFAGKNIYVPDYDKKGSGTARFAFPVSKLSQDKEKAGVVRILKPAPKSEPVVDKDAPEMDAAAWVSSHSASLASLRDETVVLAFWDHTDEACAELVQLLNRLLVEYPEKGVEFVSIHSSDADLDDLMGFISEKSVRFRVAVDKPAANYKGATFGKYYVRKVPAVFIIDTEGIVRYQDIPLAAVEEALKLLLHEQ
jgi:peroxiredoxin